MEDIESFSHKRPPEVQLCSQKKKTRRTNEPPHHHRDHHQAAECSVTVEMKEADEPQTTPVNNNPPAEAQAAAQAEAEATVPEDSDVWCLNCLIHYQNEMTLRGVAKDSYALHKKVLHRNRTLIDDLKQSHSETAQCLRETSKLRAKVDVLTKVRTSLETSNSHLQTTLSEEIQKSNGAFATIAELNKLVEEMKDGSISLNDVKELRRQNERLEKSLEDENRKHKQARQDSLQKNAHHKKMLGEMRHTYSAKIENLKSHHRAEIQKYETHLERNTLSLQNATKELEVCHAIERAKSGEMEAKLLSLQRQVAELSSQNSSLEMSYNDAQQNAIILSNQFEESKKTISSNNVEINQQKNKLIQLNASLDEIQEDKIQLQQTAEGLTEHVAELEKERDGQSLQIKQLNEQCGTVDEELQAAKRQSEEFKSTISSRDGTIEGLELQIKELETVKQQVTQTNETLGSTVDDLQKKTKDLEESYSKNVEELKKQNSCLTEKVDELTNTNTKKEQTNQKLVAELEKGAENRDQLLTARNDLRIENGGLRKKLKELGEENENLKKGQDQIHNVKREMKELQQQRNVSERKQKAAEKQCDTLKAKVADVEAKLRAMKQANVTRNTEAAKMDRELKQTKKKVANLQKENEKLKTRGHGISNMKQGYDEVVELYNESKEYVEKLTEDLNTLVEKNEFTESEIKKVSENLEVQMNEKLELERSMHEINQLNGELESKLSECEKKCDELIQSKNDNSKSEAATKELRSDIEAKQVMLQSLEEKLSKTENELKNVKIRMKSENEQLTEGVQKAESTLSEKHNALDEAQFNVRKLKQQERRDRLEIDSLEKQLASSVKQTEDCKTALASMEQRLETTKSTVLKLEDALREQEEQNRKNKLVTDTLESQHSSVVLSYEKADQESQRLQTDLAAVRLKLMQIGKELEIANKDIQKKDAEIGDLKKQQKTSSSSSSSSSAETNNQSEEYKQIFAKYQGYKKLSKKLSQELKTSTTSAQKYKYLYMELRGQVRAGRVSQNGEKKKNQSKQESSKS